MPFAEPGGTGHGLIMTLRDVTLEREFEAMRSSFVLRASHELRTPVTSIRMGLDLLSERLALPDDSLERELLDAVLAETQRMVRLLTDLLDLSRFQSGDQPLDRQPSDVAELLSRAAQRFRSAAADKGIALEVETPAELPPCRLDALQMDRVLDNLLSNALRHTQSGGRISLCAQRYPDGIEISVSDTGEGIPIVQQSRIFKPFVQVGSHRGGAGLGLAIANEIVHQHGGEIVLNSAPNRGATFSVRLPA
jgi:NtrC-family two-component system sensor histidine kinase KinB